MDVPHCGGIARSAVSAHDAQRLAAQLRGPVLPTTARSETLRRQTGERHGWAMLGRGSCNRCWAAAPALDLRDPVDQAPPLPKTLAIAVMVFQLRVVTGTPKSRSNLLKIGRAHV